MTFLCIYVHLSLLEYVIDSQFVTSEWLNNICWKQHICVTTSRAWPCPSVKNLQKGLKKKWQKVIHELCNMQMGQLLRVQFHTSVLKRVINNDQRLYYILWRDWLIETKCHLEHYQIIHQPVELCCLHLFTIFFPHNKYNHLFSCNCDTIHDNR